MKFLVVHPNMDIYGGGERVCHHILKTLIAHGQEVELLSFDFDEKHYEEIMGEKLPREVKLHMLGNREMVEANPPFSVYKRRRNIIRLLKNYKATAEYDYLFSTQMISAFETTLLKKERRNIAYVHFPEIPYDYEHSKRSRRLYLWLYKKLLERHMEEFGLLFCNSNYTKAMTQKYWSRYRIDEPILAYPPVETPFWSTKPLEKRVNRVVYVARFIPQKRHQLLKQLALEFPQLQFVSVGLLRGSEEAWFSDFSKNLPSNYALKPNLPETEKIRILQNSTVYCHLMEGEHFGIAPMEALASGCITLVHNSGGSGEFVPIEFRWTNYEDLKSKIGKLTNSPNAFTFWTKQKVELHERVSVLRPGNFENQIWSHVESLMQKTM